MEFGATEVEYPTWYGDVYYGDILEGLRPPPAWRALSIQAPWRDIYELLYLWLASSPIQLQIDALDLLDGAEEPESLTSKLALLHSYDLSHNTRLKPLTLRLEAYRMPEYLGIPADVVAAESGRICNIINQITSPVIETITFVIAFELAANIRLLDLAEMDGYFQRPNFASLKTVRVEPDYIFEDYEGCGDDHPTIIQEWLQATFPRSLARGIIDCGFPPIGPSRLLSE
ncbi:hypothetical protein FIBSPDRAFT_928644 [Athelia psychrophila]|uniref:Uncharacterized protein n=1 Tax=Athelia psychrophila TaxID=1759441 RepID=A0A166PVC0_9AGAM|nr:hypothetical protein FIBSPDRAFT_928644 [Fibularhizoctonia sp. CBS 109695]